MRSHQFTVNVPSGYYTQPQYIDLNATGTGLDGIAAGAPCVLNLVDDLGVLGQTGGGDAVPTVRVSALNTIRVRVKGQSGGSFDALITEL
jgi:hypothetical protein